MRNNSYITTSMKQYCVKLSVATLQIEEASAGAAALPSADILSWFPLPLLQMHLVDYPWEYFCLLFTLQ